MTSLLAGTCVALAAFVQIALVAAGAALGDLRGLPLLPLAMLAAWAAARGPYEAWAGLLPAPLVLGLASDERVAWFLLALAPTPLLAAALQARTAARPRPAARGTLGAAAGAAFVGVLAYTVLLAVPAGDSRALLEEPGPLARGALLTSMLATAFAAVLLALRPQRRGLFG